MKIDLFIDGVVLSEVLDVLDIIGLSETDKNRWKNVAESMIVHAESDGQIDASINDMKNTLLEYFEFKYNVTDNQNIH